MNTITAFLCTVMVKAQNKSPNIHINCSRTNCTIHFNLFCIANSPIVIGKSSIRNLTNISPRHIFQSRFCRNKFCAHRNSLISWSIVIGIGSNLNCNSSCTRCLINAIDCNYIAIKRNSCNIGITGRCRNRTSTRSSDSNRIGQFISVQNNRSLTQT